jgi:hypothetical protein
VSDRREGEGQAGGQAGAKTGLTNRDQQQMSEQTKRVKIELSKTSRVLVRAILEYTWFVGNSDAEYVDGCAPNCDQLALMRDMIACCDEDVMTIVDPITVVCKRVGDYLASASPRNAELKAEMDRCREVLDRLKLRGCDQSYLATAALEKVTKKYDDAIDEIAETISDEFSYKIDAIRDARRKLSLLLMQ